MTRVIFYTVTNSRYYPGTVATLSSIRKYYPDSPVWVFPESRYLLTSTQKQHLASLTNVYTVCASDLSVGTIREAWQVKAHAAHYLAQTGPDLIIQVDSDAVLSARLDPIIEQVLAQNLPAGGQDGGGVGYDPAKFAPYHDLCDAPPTLRVNARGPYISTSILFLPVPRVAEILKLWSIAVDEAHWGPDNRPRKIYAGYSDQGVFNAILHFKGIKPIVLENDVLSQHWVHGTKPVDLIDGQFYNKGRVQYAFHSVGQAPKFWYAAYVAYAARMGTLDEVYRYWLSLLLDGPCGLRHSADLRQIRENAKGWFPGLSHDLVAEYERRCLTPVSPPVVSPGA